VTRYAVAPYVVAITLALAANSVYAGEPADSTDQDQSRLRHTFGGSAAYYNHHFTDAVVSPVVYGGAGLFVDFYYRGLNDVHLFYVVAGVGGFDVDLRDGATGDEFTILNRRGEPYSFLRSLHQLRGVRMLLAAEYLHRIRAHRNGRTGLHFGGRIDLDSERYDGTDRWSDDIEVDAERSWRSDVSIGASGALDSHFRHHDRLALGMNLTLLSYVSRPPYFHPFDAPNDDSKWMLPTDFLRWTVSVSYEFWITEKFGLTTYYQFQYQRVTEPRALRSVTNVISFGWVIGRD